MKARDIPNLISVLRILLVPPIVWLILQERYAAALALFTVAGISDGIDGYLAKRFRWHSRLGSILDPLADKLLMVSSYLVLAWMGHLPLWLAALVIARDVVIVFGALAYQLTVGHVEMAPTFISKVNTTVQVVLIIAVMASLAVLPLPIVLVDGLVLTVAATTLLSGAVYVWLWTFKARDQAAAQRRGHD